MSIAFDSMWLKLWKGLILVCKCLALKFMSTLLSAQERSKCQERDMYQDSSMSMDNRESTCACEGSLKEMVWQHHWKALVKSSLNDSLLPWQIGRKLESNIKKNPMSGHQDYSLRDLHALQEMRKAYNLLKIISLKNRI